ncbi:chitinase-3-like protein 1 [Haemaphysalis longicornis]
MRSHRTYQYVRDFLTNRRATLKMDLTCTLFFHDDTSSLVRLQSEDTDSKDHKRPGGDGRLGRCLVLCVYDPAASEWDPSVRLDLDAVPFAEACTHLVYSDLVFNARTSAVEFGRPDLAKTVLPKFTNAARKSKSTLMAELRCLSKGDVTGMESSLFPTPQAIPAKFAEATSDYLRAFGFYGISLDVYNPVTGPAGVGQYYLPLLKALKVGLGAQNILLAASVYFTKGLNVGLDYNEIHKNVDILVLGTHDLLRSDQSSDLPSPLYGATPNDPSWDSAVNPVLDVTHSTEHVVASLSFSGAQFLLRSQPQADREMATSGLPASRVTGGGHYTRINGTLSFFEICLLFHSEPWKHAVSKDASCPILNRGTNWIGYDNAWSIRQKALA